MPHPLAAQARSSRDPIAERRLARAKAAFDDGAFDEAADLFEQALLLAPDWSGAWVALGTTEMARGRIQEAASAFRMALTLDPLDMHGAALGLAQISGVAPAQAPSAYVKSLFDAYAPRFEAHLVETLGYDGPDAIGRALSALGVRRFGATLDLGCGTGLCGAMLRAMTDRLSGVDLSSRMVEQARAKAIYDRLVVGDIVAFLTAEPSDSADLIVAADVLIYFGDLTALLTSAWKSLRPDGLVAVTVQLAAGRMGWMVGSDLRFAHTRAYVETSLAATGFEILLLEERSVRREKGTPTPGLMVVAARRSPLAY